MFLIFQKAILKKLPAYETYEIFENIANSSDYNSKCKSLESTGNKAKELCEKYAKNLEYTCTSGTTTTTGKSISVPEAKVNCLLLKYWLFYEIKKLSVKEPKNKNLDTIIHTIYYLQFEINKKENQFYCFNDIYEYLHKWEDEKYLYEYFKNFPKIESFDITKNTECKAYKKYINHVKTYYDKKKKNELCCKDNYFKCSDYFNCDPKYNPEKILNKISRTNTTAEGASVSGSTPNSDKAKEIPKTRIENHRCIVRRNPEDPHLAYLSCFNVPTVYKDVDDYFPATNIPTGETGDNSEGKNASSSKAQAREANASDLSREGEGATNPGSSSEGSPHSKNPVEKSEEGSSDSSPKVNILDKVKSLLGLGKYIRNIIDREYPLFIRENKTTIENGSSHTYITPSWKKVQIENTEENYDLLKSSDNFFNTKPFKSIMTAILTFGVIFVFFIYYKVSKIHPFEIVFKQKV
ncbi:variable surface protein Vir12-related [Plasmodium vivax]|uniref:Variable surface protein Vir12-related n=1 Tax=Plasmodium vivax (strain Salvador I) TaxID=126793 RepID=A5KBR4_PLAVS|nr:variable surface protein Vir12-related [Plasmodium vivax]EDL43110.1 variable surface protein Vir12-related [Plasmodium vivax]|eukprot:XP_001612837.1 variable surface protein Vir12-related [Plasmodium vivax Sal-1]